jgi:EAL domain-containing protein (putative c-di-GMP-specific phosphodiesterase class I)
MFSMTTHPSQRASDQPAAAPPSPCFDPELEDAIRADAIDIVFQPQIEPIGGRVIGAEALARWDKCASADELFHRAAEARLAERLSRSVQRKAIRMAARWQGPLKRLRLSINALPADLNRAKYEQWLLGVIAAEKLDPARLTLEIVETALVIDRPAVAERLQTLRDQGIGIAVDDFGTGYANLAYLTSLPLDSLKIDQALVADLVGGSREKIVVKAMIGMASDLGLSVTVEGVETAAQLQLLAAWGCDCYQGFLGAGAMNEAELARFVAIANAAPIAA